ncbi:MAG: hypothetical protein HYS70_01255 [Nitrospinae bacterium]|nr:hypothetical protein [Nitrospinota bacterium]
MELKLDLHTHPFEAMGFPPPDEKSVGAIIRAAKAKGLDGIAITEHYSPRYGFRAREIVQRYFPGALLIIPGQETRVGQHEVVELYLDDALTFKFLAHPQSTYGFQRNRYEIQGIEIENFLHNDYIDREGALRIAQENGLLLLKNSDAHLLEEIGNLYNCLELEELRRLVLEDGRTKG